LPYPGAAPDRFVPLVQFLTNPGAFVKEKKADRHELWGGRAV
jgi:hypothetical protein